MTIRDVARILEAEVCCGEDKLEREVYSAFGSDLMSDVLAFARDQQVLLTGLVNAQAVRTAELMDMSCIVLVRNKKPDAEMLGLARERGIALLSTNKTMFLSCGLLYAAGLTDRGLRENA
jgi:predicted transcriptional regulator